MRLDELRIFVAVAERQHVTQATRVPNPAQSAASHAIAASEACHDTKLFDRVGRWVELTEAERAFLLEARTILAQVERAAAPTSIASVTWAVVPIASRMLMRGKACRKPTR
jgi:DNA-binding transcriptional LysR family regulator